QRLSAEIGERSDFMRAILTILLLAGSALRAQQAPISGDDHALIQQLLQRVKDLEDEVRRLNGGAPPAVPPAPAQPAPPPATAAAAPQPSDMMHDMGAAGLPSIQFRGFSDIRYTAYDHHTAPNTFALGQFNLFMTSKLSEKLSVLGELVVEAAPTNGM